MTLENNAYDVHVSEGFREDERQRAAALFWSAFQPKLAFSLGPDRTALTFLSQAMNPAFALVARDGHAQLLGLAGYKTRKGALVEGTMGDLRAVYGLFGALWRAALLSSLEREPENGTLLMDGIFVDETARGRGVGTALLTAVKEKATKTGATSVRLDVIDSNPRAKQLYERQGFVAQRRHGTGALRRVFGFTYATEMRWSVKQCALPRCSELT